MKTRIGILTGGDDCPGLNTVIRTVAIATAKNGWTTFGFLGGFEGPLNPVRTRVLDPDEMDSLLFIRAGSDTARLASAWLGGTVGAGLSRDGRASRGVKPLLQQARLLIASGCEWFDQRSSGLAPRIFTGGTILGTSNSGRFSAKVGHGETREIAPGIIAGTSVAFGFDTAVSFATDAPDRLRCTAASHERVLVCEMMDRYAGWIAAHRGITRGDDARG